MSLEITHGIRKDDNGEYTLLKQLGKDKNGKTLQLTLPLRIDWQSGPSKERGVNGLQVEAVLRAALERLEKLDARMACVENKNAINHIRDALAGLDQRTTRRRDFGVEGTRLPAKGDVCAT